MGQSHSEPGVAGTWVGGLLDAEATSQEVALPAESESYSTL